MSYIPKYLEFNLRQFDGWPTGITESGKEWAVKKVQSLYNVYRFVTLDTVRRELFESANRPEEFKGVASYDYLYAVAHRALLAADGNQVWVHERYYDRRMFLIFVGETEPTRLEYEQFKKQLHKKKTKTFPEILAGASEKLFLWIDSAQIGDVFLVCKGSTVVCVDKASNMISWE